MALSSKEKTGRLKPLDPTKVAPAIRLVTSATYVRHVVEDTSGVPMNSTYRATLADHAKDGADMLARCVASCGGRLSAFPRRKGFFVGPRRGLARFGLLVSCSAPQLLIDLAYSLVDEGPRTKDDFRRLADG